MADQVRVFVSHHHSPEEDTFTARLVAIYRHSSARLFLLASTKSAPSAGAQ